MPIVSFNNLSILKLTENKMKCPKCRDEMKPNIEKQKYECLNEKCRHVIEWGSKENE